MSVRVEWHSPGAAAARAAFEDVGARAGPHAGADPVDGAIVLGIASSGGVPRARASLWHAEVLAGASGWSGLVGHYEALDPQAGTVLLRAACEELSRNGAVRVLGPMNGSTWRRYRLELPRETGDPDIQPAGFASEPRNPPRYRDDFLAAGFAPVAHYESRYEPEVRVDAAANEAVRERVAAHGIRLHALAPAAFEEALVAMHAMSLDAFAANAFYSPLPLGEFLALYAPYRERIVPSFVRLATTGDGRLAGYLFGFPDPLSAPGGRPVRSVCKTVAVAPFARSMGLGGLLLDDFRAASAAASMNSIVHALMHVDNASMRMSARHRSVLFKRYALYGWTP